MEELIKKKHAFLFQGVGAEYQKLLHRLDEDQKETLRYYCSIVNKEIGMDLWNYLFNAEETKYNKMFNDWIAIYTCDYIIYHTYRNEDIKPGIFLGYSMGLITAMACGKSITFESGLHMLLNIYEYPQYAPRQEEGMAVIVGMSYDHIDQIILLNSLKNYVQIASENNAYCIVISGIRSGVEKVMTLAADDGALMVKTVNAPYAFHSPYAASGIERYVKFVSRLQVFDCNTPIISSFNQDILQEACDLKRELIKNMTSRMYWKTAIQKIGSMGIRSFVEVSLDDSLVKFSKTINGDYEFFTYNKWLKLKTQVKQLV